MVLQTAVLLQLAGPAAAAEMITPIVDILKNRERMNGRYVCVVGEPVITENKIGRVTGKHLFRGGIDDETGALALFAFGKFPIIASGELIEVCGKYRKFYLYRHGVGYHNEIGAAAILKGSGIASGMVEITGAGIVPRKKKRSAVPPPP